MKKKLEAELISIAHRILKLKNKSELSQLHQETQKLYEKLSVLKFVEENFSDAKPTIGLSKIEELVEAAFENEEIIVQEETVLAPVTLENEADLETIEEVEEESVAVVEEEVEEASELEEEPEIEEEEIVSEETIDFEPHFELFKEEEVEAKKEKTEAKQISFEDMLASHSEPIFERKQNPIFEVEPEVEPSVEIEEVEVPELEEEVAFSPAFEISAPEEIDEPEAIEKTPKITNDSFAKTISFGLNDKIAFEKQLFGGSSEDLNRVISQLSTFDTFDEAENFIEDMVKPDYNNWEGKDDYVARFMEIVEKKFA